MGLEAEQWLGSGCLEPGKDPATGSTRARGTVDPLQLELSQGWHG